MPTRQTGWAHRLIVTALFLVGLAGRAAFAAPPMTHGFRTAPVRHYQSEQSVCSQDVVNPIYYPITISSDGMRCDVVPETLLRTFMERHTAMDYPAAVEAAMLLTSAAPDRPEGYYNLACALSRLRRRDEAFAALSNAIDNGWRDLRHMRMDPDLAALRDDARFESLLAMLAKHIDAERIIPGPLHTEDWPIIAEDVRAAATDLLKRYHVLGATIALVHDGRVVYSQAFGVRDVRSSQPLEAHDCFPVHAPCHLLAVMACRRAAHVEGLALGDLIVQAVQMRHEAQHRSHRGRSVRPASSVGFGEEQANPSGDRHAVRGQGDDMPSSVLFNLMRLSLEASSGQSFADLCRTAYLEPLGMKATKFADARALQSAMVIGHSRLGTPMADAALPPIDVRSAMLLATAEDLARLIASTMQDSGDATDANSIEGALALIRHAEDQTPGGLGLAMVMRKTNAGTRIEVAQMRAGIGCLMRWYPQAKRGVVVLYNSATGYDAATRIAHRALGGE